MTRRQDLPIAFLLLAAATAFTAVAPGFAHGQEAPPTAEAAVATPAPIYPAAEEAAVATPTPLSPAAMTLRQERRRAGERDYERWCAWCHGERGDGRGISAQRVDPRPRDFTQGNFKCRTTPSGALPSDDDLRKTLRNGLHASAMPSWSFLGEMQIDDLVEWVKQYSDRFETEAVPPSLVVPPEPPASKESIAHGAELYQKLGCVQCHGKALQGNGPSSRSQKDDDGNVLLVADLTRQNSKKCGDSAERLYTTLRTGLNGTPMPSFADGLTPEETWDVVHFVRSREEPRIRLHP